ncbi:MAG: hypothetical protein QOJ88_338 [Pyrinomonadaceae bacterium]|nr:hypothetical protein [Pyrinomonadaceae bacterium]
MELISRTIRKQRATNIVANREEFRRIFDDMCKSAGSFTPTPTWLLCKHPSEIESTDLSEILDRAGSDEVFQQEFADLDQRMNGWVGDRNAELISEKSALPLVESYGSFLQRRDSLGLWRTNVKESTNAEALKVADLGSLMDLTFLYTYAFDPARKITTILEVGGGYGRLAEAAFNIFGKSIRYVLVDSVPVSLYYSKKYLESVCPEIRVGSYYDGDNFDMSEFDCYVIPAWYFDELNKEKYDVCINIESFQEMGQQHIDHYLQLFDRVSVDRAVIYLDNARDYIFRGDWNFPNHWQKLFCSNTPRSWSPDHPAEVFVKSTGDFSAQNAILDDIHHFVQSAPEPAVTLGSQIEALAGKRVRTVLGGGRSQLKKVLEWRSGKGN